MTSDYLRNEILDSIDFVEAVLGIEAPGEVLDCLAVEAQLASSTLLFPAGDAARLKALLGKLRSWRDGRRRLPPLRASKLAAAIVSLDPDVATWGRENVDWAGAMQGALGNENAGALAAQNDPVRVRVRGADLAEAERRIAWVLGQLGVPE